MSGAIPKRPRARLSDEQVATMFADFQRLKSLKKAAAMHGRKIPTLWRLFKDRGLITPKSRVGRDELAKQMYADYQAGMSLEDVADKYECTRQNVFGYFQVRGFKLRAKTFLPAVEYDGRKFTCQKTCGRHRYLRDTLRGRGRKGKRDRTLYLHHLVWEEHHGPIPPGHKVAFRDGNHLNCNIDNLELLTNSEQVRKYACKGQNQFTVTAKPRLDALLGAFAGGERTLAAKLKGAA